MRQLVLAFITLTSCMVGAGFTTAFTIDQILASQKPDVAMRWWGSAKANGAMASVKLADSTTLKQSPKAKQWALTALRRSAAEVPALRSLAIVAALENDTDRATALLELTERLSRRDLLTQLMLIEAAVQAHDILRALSHYDRALRVHPTSQEVLFPVLIGAASDPEIADALIKLLQTRPPYGSSLTGAIFRDARNSALLVRLLEGLRLDPRDDGPDRALLSYGLQQIVQLGAFDDARRVYSRYFGEAAMRSSVRDGSFDSNIFFPPFSWQLASEANLAGVIEQRSNGDPALHLIGRDGRSGEVARQLLMLESGRYQLDAIAGDISGDALSRPSIEIECAVASRPLGRLQLPVAPPEGRRISMKLDVAPDCPAQWLKVKVGSSMNNVDSTPWVDSIAINLRGR